jgi:hypothetical protein
VRTGQQAIGNRLLDRAGNGGAALAQRPRSMRRAVPHKGRRPASSAAAASALPIAPNPRNVVLMFRTSLSSQLFRREGAWPACRWLVRIDESLPPAWVAQRPPELAFGLRVRGAARLGCDHDLGFARDQPREPTRNVAGWFSAEHVREHREPLAHRGGLVVDDVEDAGVGTKAMIALAGVMESFQRAWIQASETLGGPKFKRS